MLYGDVHPSIVIHLVNCTCENLQQEETRVLLKTGDQHTRRTDCRCRIYLRGKIAKLGGVLLFVDTHPSTHIQSVNCTCEN